MEICSRFTGMERKDGAFLLHTDNADIKVCFVTDEIVRVRASFDHELAEESYVLMTTAWEDRMDELFKGERTRITALDVPCAEDDKTLTFETAHLTLKLFKKPFHFELFDKSGKLIYQDLRERAFEKDQIGRLSHFSKVDREFDHFYGFGEKTGHLDKKGRRLRMSPKDAIGHDPETGDPMYKHIPFYIRVNEHDLRPVGLFYHNSYDCVFDLGEELSGYWERYCYYQTDGGDIDLFLLAGETLPEILNEYTLLTGRSALPTKQSLGYCASTMYYAELEKNCDEEIYKVIDKHEKEGILIDNFWLASGYSSGEKDNLRYVFNWNHKRFPEPEKFFENMNARGINVIPNLKPGILKHHPYIDLFEKNDVFIKTPDGKAPYYGRWWGGDNLTDWRTVKFNIATILGMGLSGCSNMGCDIGGFAGPAPEAELLLRWLQNGIFQPRFCLNSANNDNTVTQPWMYEENLPYIRAAYQLRYRLLPTLYSLMYESNQNGMPAWRPLFLEFPDDPKCYTDKNLTFMFGKSILVANVVEKGATTRTVYLPAGCTWYDMNDNLRAYEGGQTIEIPVTLASIPMFLRGSAVVVTTEDVKHILKDTMRQIDLLVAAETDTSFVLYDDDGHTEDYKNGVYAKTTITVKAGDRTDIRFATEGSYASPVERMTLKLVSKKKGALWASVDGQQLPQFIVRDGWEAAESGWYYNLPDRTIWVKFAKPAKKDFTVTVSTEKFDLIGMAED